MLLESQYVTTACQKRKPRRMLYKAWGKNESSSMLLWLWYSGSVTIESGVEYFHRWWTEALASVEILPKPPCKPSLHSSL